jgi:hypothetical protein
MSLNLKMSNKELNRAIAVCLGWRCVAVETNTVAICKPPNRGTVSLLPGAYAIFNPEGESLWTEGNHHDPDRAWDYAVTYLTPNWATNVSEALILCVNIVQQHNAQLDVPNWNLIFYGDNKVAITHSERSWDADFLPDNVISLAYVLAQLAYKVLSIENY